MPRLSLNSVALRGCDNGEVNDAVGQLLRRTGQVRISRLSSSLADGEDDSDRLGDDGCAALAVAVDVFGEDLGVERCYVTVEEGDVGERVIPVGSAAMTAGDADHPVDFPVGGRDAVGRVAGPVHDPV